MEMDSKIQDIEGRIHRIELRIKRRFPHTDNPYSKDKVDSHGELKEQRDILIRFILKEMSSMNARKVSELLDNQLTESAINLIRQGKR